MSAEVLKLIKEKEAKFVDLRFTDTRGKDNHVTVPASQIDDEFFTKGKMFDGSSINGWKDIHEADMILSPDASTAVVDVFSEETTINLRCDVVEPDTGEGYNKCPRVVGAKAEKYLAESGIADTAFFGPENEFFIFDDVAWGSTMNECFHTIDSSEGVWNTGRAYDEGNLGHRPGIKGGYYPVAPVDSLSDMRATMCIALEDMGLVTEVHHHEVATGGQCEIGVRFDTLVKKADAVQTFKYVVMNVANAYGKSATFMPKPLVGDNGSGMHVHQSIAKGGTNLFSGDVYAGLSETALFYIGGIIKHAKAVNAFTNPSTNSYKRLVPGFEAPTFLAYSAKNRSASIRIPYESNPKAARIEVRFPDSTANPYFAFAAMLMAGLDGIKNKIHPGDASDADLFALAEGNMRAMPTVSFSLEEALDALDKDRDFLKEGGVFDDEVIDAYINLKSQDVTRLRMTTHPVEFDMYYSL